MTELTPAEYSMAWAARRIIDELQHPALSAADSLATLRQIHVRDLQHAQDMLALARAQAQNNDPAQPDEDGAAKFCGYCGNASEDELADDGLALTGERIADPSWLCADTSACIARRKSRYPARKTPGLAHAQRELELAAHAAAPSVLALTALIVAQEAEGSQQAAVALSSPRRPAQRAPAPLYGDAYRLARRSHTLINSANRSHLISGRKRAG